LLYRLRVELHQLHDGKRHPDRDRQAVSA
jgi:hypothetical protein